MSSADQPVLPQGAGYGVGAFYKFYPHSQTLTNGTFGVQSSVRLSSWLSYFDLKVRPYAQA